MNHITIELCAEDRARLDAILAALTGGGKPAQEPKKVEPRATEPEQPKKAAEPKPQPQAVEEAPKAEAQPAPEVKTLVPVEEVQRLVMTLVTAGKKAEVRAIVTAYAPKVTDIPAELRAEVCKKLKALEV